MIFISYRRSDGKAAAQLLKKSLIDRGFDSDDIFLDLHNIISDDFTERCRVAISSCDQFILLVTKDSFLKRENCADYYWQEIHQALDERKKIIPVIYESEFEEKTLPREFIDKKLHLKHAIRYDVEYSNDSMNKIVNALTEGSRKTILKRAVGCLTMPILFIMLYLMISVLAGVVRYVWDNYWLSDDACKEIAKKHLVKESDNIYSYYTHDAIYTFNNVDKMVVCRRNVYEMSEGDVSISINKTDMYQAGFWTMAIGLVHEVGKVRIKPHGNPKVIGVTIVAGVSVVAGFGLGFVCERMLFPVYESRLIREKLNSPEWWTELVSEQHQFVNRVF